MKRLLNTLFVTTQGSYLSKKGETVLVNIEKEVKLRIPIHTLRSIICFGRVSCSPFLMDLCGKNNVHISFLTEYGKFMARVHGPVSGNVLLRRQQYRIADNKDASAQIARNIIAAKISNSKVVLSRLLRDKPEHPEQLKIKKASKNLSELLDQVGRSTELDSIRGIEGYAAKHYFDVFDEMIVAQKAGFKFSGRNRRPPLDNINALLSFIYTLLHHDIASSLEGVGLDPAVGFLHCDRPGRNSLALDMMEELRSVIADRLALTLINRQQVKKDGFQRTESGAVLMNDKTRKQVLISWQNRKKETITHPYLGEKVEIGLIPHVQSMLLARFIRGDIDGYPALFWR